MIPRKPLEIGWSDLIFGFWSCLWTKPSEMIHEQITQRWSSTTANLVCLSVRSGFDALLGTLNFPFGSEILVSAITIRDMPRIIEAHGLIPVPIDLDVQQLAVQPKTLEDAITPQTKAMLIAHLFGSRMPMEPVIEVARRHGLMVIEDCAQSYASDDYRGHPDSDVCMVSFGPIKTATALGGGLLSFRDSSLCARVLTYRTLWPTQSRWRFLRRIGKYACIKLLSNRILYRFFVWSCKILDKSHDEIILNNVRGFAEQDFFSRIRQRPSEPLLALIDRRIRNPDHTSIAKRIAIAQDAIKYLSWIQRPGEQAYVHTHWVFPILHPRREFLMHYLWQQGFDATIGASSLYVMDAPKLRPETLPTKAKTMFSHMLYLPIYAGISSHEVKQLSEAIRRFEDLNPQVSVS